MNPIPTGASYRQATRIPNRGCVFPPGFGTTNFKLASTSQHDLHSMQVPFKKHMELCRRGGCTAFVDNVRPCRQYLASLKAVNIRHRAHRWENFCSMSSPVHPKILNPLVSA